MGSTAEYLAEQLERADPGLDEAMQQFVAAYLGANRDLISDLLNATYDSRIKEKRDVLAQNMDFFDRVALPAEFLLEARHALDMLSNSRWRRRQENITSDSLRKMLMALRVARAIDVDVGDAHLSMSPVKNFSRDR